MHTLRLCALSKIHPVVRSHHQVFCVLSKNLYGRVRAVALCPFFELVRPRFVPWVPLYIFVPIFWVWTVWSLPKGLLRQFPQRARAKQAVAPWVTGQDLVTTTRRCPYPLKRIFLWFQAFELYPGSGCPECSGKWFWGSLWWCHEASLTSRSQTSGGDIDWVEVSGCWACGCCICKHQCFEPDASCNR